MFLPQEDVSDVAKASVVHLRLLFAFRKLRLEIGSRRDLWGINDDRLDDQLQALSGEERQQGQAKIREKRWSIYLAKAVHRYEVWWKTMRPKPLTQSETESTESARYATFPQQSIPAQFTEENLMPLGMLYFAISLLRKKQNFSIVADANFSSLDVLMVWHTHMLNPRLYLEDTMRQGRGDIWSSGLPWNLLSRCITHDDFTYNVGDASKLNWESATGLSWDNTNDPPHIEVACPACESPMKFAWTTCNLIEPEDSVLEATLVGSDNEDEADRAETATIIDNGSSSLQLRLNLIGNGLADGKISQRCYSCRTEVDQDLLCFHKFMRDAKSLGDGSNSGHCMPATLLDPRTGMPELNMSVDSIHKKNAALTAPNRLVYGIVRTLELELNKYRHQGGTRPTMEGLRDRIHRNLHLAMNLVEMAGEKEPYSRAARLAERVQKEVDTGSSYRKARVVLRSMLAQYADNWSPFALDLRAAMLRQSLFIDNMYKFDWLHGPDPQATTARAVNKYIRFIELARMNPGRMVVPTLDVDLAWHTHQLSPKAYYRATTLYISNFLDHDDKVDEDKLSVSFDWMSEAYYQKYKEIYSECLCWYCQGGNH